MWFQQFRSFYLEKGKTYSNQDVVFFRQNSCICNDIKVIADIRQYILFSAPAWLVGVVDTVLQMIKNVVTYCINQYVLL